jgi:YebC/PmpR family DNA-binding regulatory protein
MGAQWKAAGKLANANARGKIISKLTKDIIMAAKAGADLNGNSRLRAAVESAKKQSMPRDNIERAIKKGAGLLDETVTFETVTYEGFAPHRVPVVVECLTDNKNRTTTSVRVLFRKGQLGTSGSVTWDFQHVGLVDATPPDGGTDAEEAAIEAGAQDCEADGEGGIRFYTEPTDLDAVSKALTALGWTVATIRIGWRPKNPMTLDAAARSEVDQFLSDLDADDDVQHIYVGYA